MITYELAKQLKDEGWKKGSSVWTFFKEESGVLLPIPTLSELIEACGNSFKSLVKLPIVGFNAYKIDEPEDSLNINLYTYGSTPEEAVAKLWLELNKN